mmetsp:Transcript_25145/g.68159  ORF Transcript_25145/g.68159 Transcript_25145/m.68159 type:complete len:97 (+) Transcript_25145:93-383(+)
MPSSRDNLAAAADKPYNRMHCCAYCGVYLDSSSPFYFLNDAAYCSESHRARGFNTEDGRREHHGQGGAGKGVLRSTSSNKSLDTGVGLLSQLRTWC